MARTFAVDVLACTTCQGRMTAQVFADTPLETLKAWEAFHTVDGAAASLSKRFVDSRFDFYGQALSVTPTIRPR